MTKSVKSKLISKGSSGCVFRPQIPCKKHIKTKKKSKKSITKLMISQDNQEYNFNEIIKKIKDYQKWTVLWNDKCKSSSYKELLKYTDIEKCLSNVGHIKYHKDHQFLLYQGSYAGVNMNDYCNKNITKQILTNKTKFNKFFLKLFRLVKNVFYGLTQLYNHNICHHDITIKNILIKSGKSYIIDYDISLKIEGIKKNKFLKKRMIDEYSVPRIFEAYPFEYLYYRINKPKDILDDDNFYTSTDGIDYYELYEPIHKFIFDIDTDKLRFELLEAKKKGKSMKLEELMKKLDTYSLGMLLIIPFLDAAERLNSPIKNIIGLFRTKELKPYMNLIRDMTMFNYHDRITPDEAYKRYLNLIRK